MKRIIQNNPIFNVDKKICMFWSPKSGSSTALKMFFQYIEYNICHEWIHDDRIEYFRNIQDKSQPPKDLDHYIKFQVVRNSYERAVSSYLHYDWHSSNGGERYQNHIKIPYKNLSFIEFLLYIQHQIKCKYEIDIHYDVQSQHITEQLLKDNLIVHIENFYNDINRISSVYKITLNPNTYYAPHSHKKRRQLDSYEHFYRDPLAKKLVEDIYESDIENFKFLPIQDTAKTIPINFDWKIYLEFNRDLTKNGILSQTQAEDHYIRHGNKENRVYSREGILTALPEDFDWRIYNILNPDIALRFNTKESSENHYRAFGHKENRQFRSSLTYEALSNLLHNQNINDNIDNTDSCIALINHESSLTGAPIFLQDLANWMCQYHSNIIFIDCVPNSHYKLNKNIRKYYYFKDANKLKNILDNLNNLDIIYSNSVNSIVESIDVFKKYIHKTVFHLHECREDIDRVLNNNLQYIVDNSYKTIFVAKNIAKNCNVDKHHKVSLCPEFIEKNRTDYILSQSQIDIKPKEKITIGMCGTNCHRKNPKLFASLARLNPEYDFIWIGADITQTIDSPKNLKSIPETKNPYIHLNDIDYFLLTSKRDPCPIVVLENLLLNNKLILLHDNIRYEHDITKLENTIIIRDHNNDPIKITKALKESNLNKEPNQTKANQNYILENFCYKPRYKNTQENIKHNILLSYYNKHKNDIQDFINIINTRIVLDQNLNNIYIAISGDDTDIIAEHFRSKIKDSKEKLNILKRNNSGFDIGGLIDILSNYDIPSAEYVTYIHNKNNGLWKQELYKILYTTNYYEYDTCSSRSYFLKCESDDINRQILKQHSFMKNIANLNFSYISGTCFITKLSNLYSLRRNIEYIKTNLTNAAKNDSFWQQCMLNKELFDKNYKNRKDSLIYKHIDSDARDVFIETNSKNYFQLLEYGKTGIPDYMFEHALERYIGYLITHNKKVQLV